MAAAQAFIPTPGVEDEVMGSPTAIGPFSSDTLTGTRPTRATGRLSAALTSAHSDRRIPGLVETTPIIVAW